MKAAVVTQTGVEIREVPAPVPGRNHVLVRVRACGLNRADLGVAAGHMHGAIGGPGTIVGMEFAGEVVEAVSSLAELPLVQIDSALILSAIRRRFSSSFT